MRSLNLFEVITMDFRDTHEHKYKHTSAEMLCSLETTFTVTIRDNGEKKKTESLRR